MEIKKIELKDSFNNQSFYEIVCGDLVIGHLRKDSAEQWTLFSQLPNFKVMITCETTDEGVSLIRERLIEFVNKVIEKS